jgi:Mg-chelatase subunit ChlD
MTTRRISTANSTAGGAGKARAGAQKPKKATKKPAAKTPKKPATKATKKPTKKATPGAAKKAAANKPAVKKPAVKKPAAKKPAAKKPAVKKPAARKAAARPVAKRAGAKKEISRAALLEQARAAAEEAARGSVVNHIAFVVDRSGSMQRIRAKVVQVFNAQLAALRKSSDELGQHTFVSFYTFHSTVDAPRFFARPIERVEPLSAISCTGLTALFDATGQAIVDLSQVGGAELDNVSFLVVVLTDGHENHSRRYKAKLKDMIKSAQDTGRWTFGFLVPKGGESVLKRFGIPQGNIQTWQTSAQGLRNLNQDMQRGLQTFYTARQAGQRAVVGVFTTNLKDVPAREVSDALHDASADFLRVPVSRSAEIRGLVEDALGPGGKYQKGHGYYELTKPELVQENKQLAIVENASGRIYAGDAARSLLGLPIGERFRVKPGDHGGYSIFVQSTSVNRRLVAGTTLLYRKSGGV